MIQILLWFVIDCVMIILLIPSSRKQILMHPNEMWKRSIESEKSISDKISYYCMQFSVFIFISAMIYIILQKSPDTLSQAIKEGCKEILILGFLPLIISWSTERYFNVISLLSSILVFLALILYIVEYVQIEMFSYYRNDISNILTSTFIALFFVIVFKLISGNKQNGKRKLLEKGMRKDLYYRTPRLIVDMTNNELIRVCERYFDKYKKCYIKVGDLCGIEHVNLNGVHKEIWYPKTAGYMRMFIILNILFVGIRLYCGKICSSIAVLLLIIVFIIIVNKFKKVDEECLYKIAFRYFYDDWGYCLYLNNCVKFVGNFQFIDVSKYHKYVYSFLDIAALCRAASFNNEEEKKNRICIISKNLCDLLNNYIDCDSEKNWITIIPLWIAALFEFYIIGKINEHTKTELSKKIYRRKIKDLNIFLQSFWADMERKKLEDGPSDFVQSFLAYLYT